MTRIGTYLAGKSINQSEVARKTGYTKARINQLCNSEAARLNAEELYMILLAIDVEPGEGFRQLFNDLELEPYNPEGAKSSDESKEPTNAKKTTPARKTTPPRKPVSTKKPINIKKSTGAVKSTGIKTSTGAKTQTPTATKKTTGAKKSTPTKVAKTPKGQKRSKS